MLMSNNGGPLCQAPRPSTWLKLSRNDLKLQFNGTLPTKCPRFPVMRVRIIRQNRRHLPLHLPELQSTTNLLPGPPVHDRLLQASCGRIMPIRRRVAPFILLANVLRDWPHVLAVLLLATARLAQQSSFLVLRRLCPHPRRPPSRPSRHHPNMGRIYP